MESIEFTSVDSILKVNDVDKIKTTLTDETFILRFEAWEGPIEALLDLAKSQKVDLTKIDILDLVKQFDAVIDKALSLKLELAADWLVMASWLTYLKSRLLLKRTKDTKKPIEDDDALALHLKRLNYIKNVSEALPKSMTLGKDWFAPSGLSVTSLKENVLSTDFHDFLSKYPQPISPYNTEIEEHPDLKPFDLSSVSSAISFLEESLPDDWVNLLSLIPVSNGLRLRSNIASTFIASLEMTRDGHAAIEQNEISKEIKVKRHHG